MKLSQLIKQLQQIGTELDVDLDVYQIVPFGVIPVKQVHYTDARSLRPDNSGPQQIYLHLSSKEPVRRSTDV